MEELFIGFLSIGWKDIVMILVGLLLIFLAIKKQYEPMLLLPIGFGAILVNLPLRVAFEHAGQPGFLKILFDAGIATELFPVLIFIAVGAMCDFGPMFKMPVMMFFGAAAQLGIFLTIIAALLVSKWFPGLGLNFGLAEAATIGIIGAADGPTSIYVANKLAPSILGPISVAAYSYMSLVPLIQPPIIRLLTSKKERTIKMKVEEQDIPKSLRIAFPILVTIISGFVAPMGVPLIGSLMFGNLIRECGVLEKLSIAAQNELANIVTLLLGITIGASMRSEDFIQWTTIIILILGLIAFVFDTAGGVLFAKFLNLFRKEGNKINPMIGAAGISAFPMSARVVQKIATEEDGETFVIMQAVSANVSGQLGSVMAGGIILVLVPILLGGAL
ncbi:sodium ion-translocating decarboxylase subunit beta [Brucepastera parasyntrophica]|nr:sodium ion-translocating decarboxylase subunit beta [Brucepastera parasyntrophica]ULQ61146.1 sodium ion-translocating decarboxylase subunit beta [Brucepastera parasyntrophica]